MNTYPNESLERHTRKCSICRHPDRDAIEDEFLHWHRVIWIAQEFHIADHRSIYRHARAVGLIKARRENLHSALDNIVEQSDGIRASAGDVLRAIRAYSCLDPSTGRWTEPRKEVAMTYTTSRAGAGTGLASEGGQPNTNAIGGPIPEPEEPARRAVAGAGLAREGGSPHRAAIGGPIPEPEEPARRAEAGTGSAREGGMPSIFNDDTTDPSSPNYIAPGLEDREKQMSDLIGPPVIRIPSNPLKIKGGRMV